MIISAAEDRQAGQQSIGSNRMMALEKFEAGGELVAIPEEALWLANFTSEQTKRTYSMAVRAFLGFHDIETVDGLREVSAVHLITWRDALIETGSSPRTINNRLSALSSLFNHLCEKQVINKNPVNGLRRPKVNQDRVETPIMTKRQVRQLLDAPDLSTLKGLRDSAVLHVLFYVGCRASEITTLKVKDFFEDGGYWVLDFVVKGGKKNRVAIHHEAQFALRRYLAEVAHRGELSAPLFQKTKAPFTGRQLSYQAVEQLFRRYVAGCGLPSGVSPHSARATFITEALDNNCALEDVQASVAHADISTTRMYDKRVRGYKESASFKVHF